METYRKVFIKTEADLPKERTILIAHFKHSERWTDLIYFNTSDDDEYWLSEIDWYLQPVTATEQETIKPKFSAANILSWIQDGHAVPPCNQKDLLNYMISFVNHFTLVEQEKPPEAIAKEEISEQSVEEMIDLQQYVTNLLYYAHVEAMDMHSIDFDRWVESQVDNIKEFYASQKHLPTDYPKECKGCKTPINQSFYCPDCNRRWES